MLVSSVLQPSNNLACLDRSLLKSPVILPPPSPSIQIPQDKMNCELLNSNVSESQCHLLTNESSSLYETLNDANCSALLDRIPVLCPDCSNGGITEIEPDNGKGLTIIAVLVVSLIGNFCTIILLSRFKVHKIPDVLVVGLALTDLLATLIPIPMSTYAYFVGINFTQGCILCKFFGTLAHFTRYSSSLIVTLVAVERYFAVNRPFIYRNYATPRRICYILAVCWLLALILAVIPVIGDNTTIVTHHGFCLFSLTSPYAIVILLYSGFTYVTVFVCFLLVAIELVKVYRRRKKLKVQDKYNSTSKAKNRDPELTFTKSNLTSR